MKKRLHKRMTYLFLTVILFLTELCIALFVHDAFVRPYLGDFLVVILIYCFLRSIAPEGIRLLPLYVFLFACATEFLQYLHIVEILGLSDISFFRVLIGSVFDWSDIACYAAGCAAAGICEWFRPPAGKK